MGSAVYAHLCLCDITGGGSDKCGAITMGSGGRYFCGSHGNAGVRGSVRVGDLRRTPRRTTRRFNRLKGSIADLLQPAILRPPTFWRSPICDMQHWLQPFALMWSRPDVIGCQTMWFHSHAMWSGVARYSHLMWFGNERCCRSSRLCSQFATARPVNDRAASWGETKSRALRVVART